MFIQKLLCSVYLLSVVGNNMIFCIIFCNVYLTFMHCGNNRNIAMRTSSSAIAERPRYRVG